MNTQSKFSGRVKFAVAAMAAFLLAGEVSLWAAEEVSSKPLAVVNTFQVGGEGGWDYVTINHDGTLLYVPRTTHTLVIDPATGKTLGDIPGTGHSHGVALAPRSGRGFVTDGKSGTVQIFDLKSNTALGKITAADDADGVIFDPASNKVFVACGDAGVLVPIAADVNPTGGKAEASIDLGGKPEFLAADGAGRIYVAVQDKDEVAVVDTKEMKVTAHWKTAPGSKPTGMAIDPEKGRLFIGCRNQKMIVMDVKDGSILADVPIGKGVDATAVYDGRGYASCGDGTLTVISETSPGKFEVVQHVATAPGARTMAIDPHSGKIFLPTADMKPAQDGGRPKAVAGSFKILVVANR